MNARLILGCHGRKFYGFTMCLGVNNEVADLKKLGSSSEEVLVYLDNHCKLFNTPTSDLNTINNVIQYLVRNNVIQEHIEKVIYNFINMHKPCGFYMYVEPYDI